MNGVLYAGIGAVFLLGLLFVAAYYRRGAATPPQHASRDGQTRPHPGAEARSASTAEVEAIRQAALTEADGIRRAATAEGEATRRAAQLEAESLRAQAETARSRAESVRTEAEAQVAELLAEARRNGADEAGKLTEQARRLASDVETRAARVADAEARVEAQAARTNQLAAELDERRRQSEERQRELDELSRRLEDQRAALEEQSAQQLRELERIAGLTADQAKAELMSTVEAASRRDAAILARSIEDDARAEGTERAKAIVAEAVQRVASQQTTETVVSVLHLPGDEMKGRIIGREGRNIRAFESVTGVNVIIDDTPEAVLLSCFDPVRREIGRLTLEKLVVDGRIHPHRIEEAYEQSKVEVDELCLRAARDALAEVGVGAVDERLLPTLGRLKYRTSYGQNVLAHLIETAHVAGVMAAEMGIEPTLVKRCAFLHDIGKALTHEVEGSHAIIGADLLRKYGEDEAVAHAVEAHHNEVQPRTIEAVLTQASDTCSAARPGARRESLESYIKRLERIEEIATAKQGVEKVFAMQSGREVRVMVLPSEVDDLAASVMAREIAKQIEDELTYPGQIRVTVVRESRATEIAH
jgi:ribonuclease Y